MEKYTMLGRIVSALNSVPTEMFGTLVNLLTQLGGEKGREVYKNLNYLLRGEFEVKLPSIVSWLGKTTTSATTEKFIAKEKFRKDSKEVKFYEIWDNFTSWFLAGTGKIEEPLDAQTLRYSKLTKASIDSPIIEELGGEAKAETTLTELYDLLKKQANGESRVLLTNGYANIFYIRDQNGVLRAVRVHWCVDGWCVHASPVAYPRAWHDGHQVFSRNS